MKLGLTRKFITLGVIFASLSPSFLANIAHAQQKGFGSALVDNLGPFLVPFIILILAGFTLMIYKFYLVYNKLLSISIYSFYFLRIINILPNERKLIFLF